MDSRPPRLHSTDGMRPSWNQAPRIPQLPAAPKPRPAAERQPTLRQARLIGNDMIAGGTQPMFKRPVVFDNAELQAQRQRVIDVVAKPPLPPLPREITQALPDNASFNQIAYSILIIAVLAVVAAIGPLINWAFLVYGVLAVVARFPSRIIFSSALICLIIVPITSALQRTTLANTFAVMTFYFLVIGLIRAALELRRENKLAKP